MSEPRPDTPLPEEVAVVLGNPAGVRGWVRLRTGIDSYVGESYLVRVGHQLRAVSRASALAEFAEVPLDAPPALEGEDFDATVTFTSGGKPIRIAVGLSDVASTRLFLDQPGVEAPLVEPTPGPSATVPRAAEKPPLWSPNPDSDRILREAVRSRLLVTLYARASILETEELRGSAPRSGKGKPFHTPRKPAPKRPAQTAAKAKVRGKPSATLYVAIALVLAAVLYGLYSSVAFK